LKHTKEVTDYNSVYYVHTMRKTTSDSDIANFLFVELPAEGHLVEEDTKPLFITYINFHIIECVFMLIRG
jgi:hypothetical protein